MANSKYEYVRNFESATDHKLLENVFVVVRVDGQNFHRFSKDHNFLKPNDKRCLDLMNRSALHVMQSFYPNIIMAYGHSDEYSFVIRRLANFFNRRQNKITSLITSAFTAAFNFHWYKYFSDSQNTNLIINNKETNKLSLDQTLHYPASFDGRPVLYPSEETLMDYLKWRQADCHINNLHNTTFYALTKEYTKYVKMDDKFYIQFPYIGPKSEIKSFTATEATEKLSGTLSSDKNEILFTDYGINYNNELEQFRKGTFIFVNPEKSLVQKMVKKLSIIDKKKRNNPEVAINEKELSVHERSDSFSLDLFQVLNIDIISDQFWQKHGNILLKL